MVSVCFGSIRSTVLILASDSSKSILRRSIPRDQHPVQSSLLLALLASLLQLPEEPAQLVAFSTDVLERSVRAPPLVPAPQRDRDLRQEPQHSDCKHHP